jgi:hypothetical protein
MVTLPKEMSRSSVPLHFDPECRDRVGRATQALVDMLLLSRCQCLAYASLSSFGYVASVFAPDGQVIEDVDRFNPRVQVKRYLQSWVY